MAYLDQELVDESLEPQQEQKPPQVVSAGGGAITGTSTPRPTDAKGSGSWTNLQSYTQANQEQADRMAGQIQSNLEKSRTAVEEEIKSSKDAYIDYLKGGRTTAEDQQIWWDKVTGGYTPSDTEISEMASKGWHTPGIEPEAWQVPDQAVKDYQERLNKTQTEQGRLNELKRLQGAQATRGEGQLNQLLMQNNPYARQMFEKQRSTASQVEQQKQQAQSLTDAKRQALSYYQQSFLPGAYSDIQSQIDLQSQFGDIIGSKGDYDTAQQAYTDLYNKIYPGSTKNTSDVTFGKTNKTDKTDYKGAAATTSGVSTVAAQNLADEQAKVDATKLAYENLLGENTMENVLSGYDDENRMKVLQQLMGYEPEGLTIPTQPENYYETVFGPGRTRSGPLYDKWSI